MTKQYKSFNYLELLPLTFIFLLYLSVGYGVSHVLMNMLKRLVL